MGLGQLFMSANHIAAQNGQFELQRTNQGAIYIYGLEEFGDKKVSGVSVISMSLISCPIPMSSNDPIEVNFLNQTRRVAGRQFFDNINLEVHDYIDQSTLTILENWRLAVSDPVDGRIGLAARYKKTAEIMLFGPDGSSTRSYRAIGVWPSSLMPGNIDMNSNDGNAIGVTLAVDKMLPSDGDWGGGGIIRTAASLAANASSAFNGAAAAADAVGRVSSILGSF